MAMLLFILPLGGEIDKKMNRKKFIFAVAFYDISTFEHLESLEWKWQPNWQSCWLHPISHTKRYIGTKSTTLVLKSSIQSLPILALKTEREATFILKMHSEHRASRTLENNSSRGRSLRYRREESSCRTLANCGSWVEVIIRWLLCIN